MIEVALRPHPAGLVRLGVPGGFRNVDAEEGNAKFGGVIQDGGGGVAVRDTLLGDGAHRSRASGESRNRNSEERERDQRKEDPAFGEHSSPLAIFFFCQV